jgi:multiple sugar transport system permease protein
MSKKILSTAVLNILFWGLLLFLMLCTVFPFLWMISASLKYDIHVFTNPIQWIPNPLTWKNYLRVWTEIPFLRYYKNTAIVAFGGTFIQIICCSLAAYSFARLRFIGKNIIFIIFVATLMIPWHTIMIPQYILMTRINMQDKIITLILMQTFSAFGIFLLRQFFIGLPNELREAAKIDGADELRIFGMIMLPQAAPGIATLAIFTFIGQWNDYISPLVYINSEIKFTLQLGLRYFANNYTMQYGLTMAGTMCSIFPLILIYLIFERQITQGIAFTGLKA